MRGSRLHNYLLLDPIEAFLIKSNWFTWREFGVGLGLARGAIDLFAEKAATRLAIEAELTADRVDWDVQKAIAADATVLLIVAPNARARESVRRKLQRFRTIGRAAHVRSFVLTQPQALQWLRHSFPLISTLVPSGAQHNNLQRRKVWP